MRITIRILIALLIAAALWWIGPLISVGIYRPLASLLLRQVLVGATLLWGFWPLLVRLWYWLAMGTRQLKPAPRAGGPDPLNTRLKELDRQLRGRWLKRPMSRWARWRGRLRRTYREALPWFLVLGPAGSGKSSLVRWAHIDEGGLNPSDSNDYMGGPRSQSLDFRVTSSAVWVEASGGYCTTAAEENGAPSPWTQLLRALRRHRPHPRLNGVVLCVSVTDLLDESVEQRRQQAGLLRTRLHEMTHQLSVSPPLYVALTGLDRLGGAVATLSLMSASQWTQGMGFALPGALPDHPELLDGLWRGALTDLEHRLHQQVLHAAPTAGEVATNLAQLQFVEQVGQLRPALLDYLHHLVAPGLDEPTPPLRGLWFGSVAELVDDQVAVADSYAPESRRKLSSLWTPLLQQVLLEQSQVWRRGARGWMSRLATVAKWSTVTTVGLLAGAWLAWGYWSERNHLEQTWAQFNEGKRLAQTAAGGDPSGAAPLMDIAAQMRYARAQAYDSNALMPTGYVEHTRVADAANSTYQRHLHKTLMPELHNQVQQTLQAQVDGGPGDIYLTLKVYLMLARPARRSGRDLERWVEQRWEALSAGQYSEDDKRVLLAHTRALFALEGLPGTPEDANLVQAARAKAAQVPSVTRVLQHIRDQGLPANVSDVSLSRAAGFAAAMTLRQRSNLPATDPAVPGWYTRAGYLDVFMPRLDASARAMLEEESWVLRDETLSGNSFEIDKAVQKLADATRSQFLQDYIQRWQTFLNDVTVRSFTGLDDAAQLASAMIDPQSSLAQFVRFAGRETTLTGNYEGDVDSWIDRQKHNLEKGRRAIVGEIAGEHFRAKLLPEHAVEDHFEPIRRLATQLSESSGNAGSNPMSRLFEPVYRQLGLVNGAMQAGQVLPEYDAFTRLRNEAARQPEPVRGVMLDLINNGSTLTARQSSGMLNRGAAGATRLVCDQALAGRYPLQRGARSEAGVQDFERLFGPQGTMANYFKDQLAPHIDTASTPWRARRADTGGSSLVSSEVVRSFEVSDRIRTATLDDSGRLRVSTVLRFVDMDPQLAEAQLDVAGQSLRYAHGVTTPRRIDWQAQGSNLSIRLTLKAIDGRTETLSFDGPWALFRFFDAGRLGGNASDRRETLHQGGLGGVRLEWQAVTTPSPLWSELLSSFRCPR